MKKQAFTLVELIVVITILAILSTIAFISLSGYSKEARDSKRISDTRNLLTKINVEQTKGKPLSELIINTRTESGKILGTDNSLINTFGVSNFDALKEDSKSFKDPSNKTQDYPTAYAIGGTGSGAYKFFEIATISEKENTTKIMGNYYKLETDDAESLFLTGGLFYKEGDVPIYNVNGGIVETPVVSVETPYCNTTIPSGTGIESTNIGTPTQINQAWQEGASSCGYTCKLYYSGLNCSNFIPPVGITQYGTDLIVSNGTSYTIITDKNLGATESGVSNQSYGNYYQWGNNYGFPNNGTITTTSTLVNASSNGPLNPYNSSTFIFGSSSYRYDWTTIQNDNLWGNSIDTRKGPCNTGYHIPTQQEWNNLVSIWFSLKGQTCSAISSNCNWAGTATFSNLQNDLKMPLAGYHHRGNTTVASQGLAGYYWTSTPNGANSYMIGIYSGYITAQGNTRAHGFSVRCFKN